MGLDMYLSRKTYVKRWDHQKPSEKFLVVVSRGGNPHGGIQSDRVSYVVEEVAYWRKANAIHNWFVQNVQDGRDECQESYVGTDKLRELVETCRRVLELPRKEGNAHRGTTWDRTGRTEHYEKATVVASPERAAEILPTADGFFFGSTDYDDGYIADCERTIKLIEPLLDDESGGEFYYRASW